LADARIMYLVPGPLSRGRGPEELTRRRDLLQSWAAPGVAVGIAENPGGPGSIESAWEEYLSVPGSFEVAARAEADGYDAIVLGCFGDPGLDGFREILGIPIVGPCEAAMHVACTLGHRFGIVTVLDSVVAPLHRLARIAGLDSRVAAIVACDVPVLELDGGSHDAVLASCRNVLEAGADTIVLGCMSMAFLGVAEELSAELGVPVINPARTALKSAELLVGSGLTHSKRAFPVPPKQAVREPTVNGARIHYELHGCEGAPALVLLHGGPGVGDCRDHVSHLGLLADEFRLLFYDARGSGRSEAVPPYTHEQWVADLDALTRQVGIETFALLGHSYGGIVAQEYAIAHPERLRQLILVDTSPSTVENEESIRRALADGLPDIEEGWLRRLFEGRVESDEELKWMWQSLLPLYFDGPFDPALPKQIADAAYYHYETHNYAFSVNNPSYDVRDRLPQVQVPTLVMCGASDWITPLAKSEEIVALLPSSRLEVFERSGHKPMIEEPERFHEVLRAFLKEVV
jgi:proline-specific peptidase